MNENKLNQKSNNSNQSNLDNQTTIDLVAVSQLLARHTQEIDSIDRLEEVLHATTYLTDEFDKRARKNLFFLQEEEKIKSIRFERKLKGVKELFRIITSITSIIIGLYLLNIVPLLAPLLITLGIAGAFEYPLKDVTELASEINGSNRNFERDKNWEDLEE